MYAQYMKPASKEVRMSKWIRQFHRWVSVAFVASVIATTIALMQKEPVLWMSYVPLLPLALLAITGVYMFVLPYAQKWRSARRAGG
jgi:hypothetical protein